MRDELLDDIEKNILLADEARDTALVLEMLQGCEMDLDIPSGPSVAANGTVGLEDDMSHNTNASNPKGAGRKKKRFSDIISGKTLKQRFEELDRLLDDASGTMLFLSSRLLNFRS